MVNQSTVLTNSWVQISNNEPYMLQNNSNDFIYLLAGTTTTPTTESGSFKLPPEGVVTSNMLSGIIWVKNSYGNQLVTYAK